MTYQIRFQKDHNCVLLVYTGEFDIKAAQRARDELRDVLAVHNCSNVLIDETQADNKLSVIDQHQFTAEYGIELPMDVRIAVVVRAEKMSDARFVENVAFNRGISLRVFPDRKEALKWLTDSSSERR